MGNRPFALTIFLTIISLALIPLSLNVGDERSKPLPERGERTPQASRLLISFKSVMAGLDDGLMAGEDEAIPEPRIEDDKEFEGDVEQRRRWFMFQRTFPFGTLPADARRRAWESRPPDAKADEAAAVLQWRQIGPKPTNSYFPNNWGLTSGRINAVAVSP
ncbi:MAG: hypothetical protein JO360_06330, partial [Acidobacteria bacterium]|nr:hypothetical protein [Acidobacteriota bacterium]